MVNPQVGDRKKAEPEVLLKSFVFSRIFCVIFLVGYFAISSTQKNAFLKSIAPIVTKELGLKPRPYRTALILFIFC
ncbi:hypothetical protein QUB61_39460 [Microcoleus sp. C2D2]